MSRAKRERLVLAITFGLTNIALFLFAVLPLNTVIWAEVLVAAGSAIAATLVCLNVSDRAHQNPVVNRGYLFTGAVALYTMLAFIFTGADDWGQITWPVSIFLLADAAGGYAAHIVTAGDEDA
jgi:hypothetical protein